MSAPSTTVIITTLAAFGAGMIHSFEPGHAKGVMAAYFIGQRRRLSDAFALGVIVTAAHTLSVLGLGGLVWIFAKQFPAQKLDAPAQFLGSLVVLGFGFWMLWQLRRKHELFRPHSHEHEHDCPYPHQHADEPQPTSLGQLFSVGLACGLVPCPSGLAFLPAALGTGNLALSLWYVLAYSAGIGVVVILLGVLVCKAQSLADRFFSNLTQYTRPIQFAGALLILLLGTLLAVQALIQMANR